MNLVLPMPAFGRQGLGWIVGWWPVREKKLLTFHYSGICSLRLLGQECFSTCQNSFSTHLVGGWDPIQASIDCSEHCWELEWTVLVRFFEKCIFYGYDITPQKIWKTFYMFDPPKTSISFKPWSHPGWKSCSIFQKTGPLWYILALAVPFLIYRRLFRGSPPCAIFPSDREI